MEITQARVRELFDYRDDGALISKMPRRGTKVGSVVGSISRGYLIAAVDYKLYKVHRLVFLWHYGYLPVEIDHIDLDRKNNRIENLRPATSAGNKRNQGISRNNTSGFKGVSYEKRRDKWAAQITVDRQHIFLGYYATLDAAALAYAKAADLYFGEFSRSA